jgi:hypothetical protein
MSKIEVNAIEPQCGTTLTLGASGDTVALASGASQSGFGRTGTVDWQTTVKTSGFAATAGEGYFVNTTSGAITATLPGSPTALDIIAFKDYALTFDTNNLTIDPGSNKIEGDTTDMVVNTEGRSVTLVYLDSTQGWKVVNDGNSTAGVQASFVTATGGTIKTSGNFKTHIFTGPGTFCVSNGGNSSGSNTVEYFVVAGGGSGGGYCSSNEGLGGGGAGGFRVSDAACVPAPTMSPLVNSCGALPVTAQGYPITVGAGGAQNPISSSNPAPGIAGSNSIFSTITSAGGGRGASGGDQPTTNGGAGGSGGGGARGNTITGNPGPGNNPSVSPPQGNPGGAGTPGPSQAAPAPAPSRNGGGGGGAGAAGPSGSVPQAGTGGAGSFVADAFIGGCAPSFGEPGPVSSTRYFAGGGGGSGGTGGQPGGVGGGGNGRQNTSGCAGTANTGSGGGGANTVGPVPGGGGGGAGGSGIVMIRYKFQ